MNARDVFRDWKITLGAGAVWLAIWLPQVAYWHLK